MICPNKCFDDSRALRVLVVPIGENSAFEQHFNIISQLKCMPMYDLVKPSGWGKTTSGASNTSASSNSPYRHFNWSSGSLLFEYLRYDRVPYGSAGDLGNFQTSRQVAMIMGLINYTEVVPAGTSNEEGNLLIEQEIEEFLRRYPKVSTRRIFVFNYSFHLNSVPPNCRLSADDPLAMTIFPPDGEMCGEDESLTSMVDVHLREVMSNAAVIMITAIEAQLMQCDAVRATKSQFWSSSMGAGGMNASLPVVVTSIHSNNTSANAIKLFTLYDDSFSDVSMASASAASSSPMAPASANGTVRRMSVSSTISSITASSVAGATPASESSYARYGHPTAPLSFTYSTPGAYGSKAGSGSTSVARSESTMTSSMALGRDRDMNNSSMKDVLSASSGAAGNGPASKRVSETGRVRKRMGDLCLQMCSPMDSLEHYAAAVAECRSVGDYLWLAGALEGYASAIYVCFKLGLPFQDLLAKEIKAPLQALTNQQAQQAQEQEFQPSDSYDSPPPASAYDNQVAWLAGASYAPLDSTSASLVGLSPEQLQELVLWNIAEEKAQEAINLYSKCIVLCGLEVECCLKLARLHAHVQKVDRERRVLDCVMRAVSVQGLNAQQQIECVLEGAFICKKLGNMKRKYALLLYLAALMSAEDDNPLLALELITHAGDEYGLGARHCVDEFPAVRALGSSSDETVDDCTLDWNYIRKTLLLHASHFASECDNHRAAVQCLAGAVCAVSDSEARLKSQRSKYCFNSALLSSPGAQDLNQLLLRYWAVFYPDERQTTARVKAFLYHLQYECYQMQKLQRLCVLANSSSGAVDDIVPAAVETFLASTETSALAASRASAEAAGEAGDNQTGSLNSSGSNGAFSKYLSLLKDNQLINDRMVAQVSSLYGAATGAVAAPGVASAAGAIVTPPPRSLSDSVSTLPPSGRPPFSSTPPPGRGGAVSVDKDRTPVKTPVASFVGANPTAISPKFERVPNSTVVVIEKSEPAAEPPRGRQNSVTGLHIRHHTKSLLHSVRARLRNRLKGAEGMSESRAVADLLAARFSEDAEIGGPVVSPEAVDSQGLESLDSNLWGGKLLELMADAKVSGSSLDPSVPVRVPFYQYLPGAVCSHEQQHIMSLLQGAMPMVSPYLPIQLPDSVLVAMELLKPQFVHPRQRVERCKGVAISKPVDVENYVRKLLEAQDDDDGAAVTTAVTGAGVGSLFFDPFKQKNVASAAQENVWVLTKICSSGTSCSRPVYSGFGSVRVSFSNPLSIPLLMENVTVILRCHLDVDYEAYPLGFVYIPPHAEQYDVVFTVRYFLKPQGEEKAVARLSFLEALGIEATFGASVSRIYLPQTGRKGNASKLSLNGSKNLDRENALVAVVAVADDDIVLVREPAAAHTHGPTRACCEFRGEVMSSLCPARSSRPGSSSGSGHPPSGGGAQTAVEASSLKKKLQLKFGRASGKATSPSPEAAAKANDLGVDGNRGAASLLRMYHGERYLSTVTVCNDSHNGPHPIDIGEYQITVYEFGEGGTVPCLRAYVVKPFTTVTLANNVPTAEKGTPTHALVSLLRTTHVPNQPTAVGDADDAPSKIRPRDKLKLDFEFLMGEGCACEALCRIDIEVAFMTSNGDYVQRLNLSQLVQCSGSVSATSLQSFFPPWQLTQHQQEQVLSVLRRREDVASDVNGGVVGNGVLEEMCLVGFGRAVNALEHYSAENVSFAEIDAESCTCANGASRVAMAEADITEHIVAFKLENRTNFDVSIASSAPGLLGGDNVGSNCDIFIPAPENDYSYQRVISAQSTRTVLCRHPVGEGSGILLPLHALVHEADEDKYTSISYAVACPLLALEAGGEAVAEPSPSSGTRGLQDSRMRMHPHSRPLYRVVSSLTCGGVAAHGTLPGAPITCKLRQKCRIAVDATRKAGGVAGVEVAVVVLMVSHDDHKLTTGASMNGSAAGTDPSNVRAWGSEHVLMSGKSRCVLPLPPQSESNAPAAACAVIHTVSCLFTRPGTFKVVCLVRDACSGGAQCGLWYASPSPLVVTVQI